MAERDENENGHDAHSDDDGFDQPVRKVLPFYNLRLRYLVRPRARLWIYCYPCKAEREADIPELIGRLGPDAGIAEVQKKTFRCRTCRGTFTRLRVEWLEDAPDLSTDWGG